jgi:hypothetical protein
LRKLGCRLDIEHAVAVLAAGGMALLASYQKAMYSGVAGRPVLEIVLEKFQLVVAGSNSAAGLDMLAFEDWESWDPLHDQIQQDYELVSSL